MRDNPSVTLQEGVEDSLLENYGKEVLKVINRMLWYGDYDYEKVDRGNQDHDDLLIKVVIDDWDTPDAYCSYMVFYFDKDDLEDDGNGY